MPTSTVLLNWGAMSKKKSRPQLFPAPEITGIVDAHTHLTSCRGSSIAEFVERAIAGGIGEICTVGDDLAEAELALQAARQHHNLHAACAIHPTKAHQLDENAKIRLSEMARDENCVAIGETGLDSYWIEHSPESTATLEQQEASLRWHTQLAREVGKTLMIHNREADADLLRILDDEPAPPQVMLHCFSSSAAMAREAIDRGWILSFAGNVTFKRNDELRKAALLVPKGQLLIETDAPFMTPEPFRGAPNEPSLVGHTALCVAQQRGQSPEELAAEVRETYYRVYGLATESAS